MGHRNVREMSLAELREERDRTQHVYGAIMYPKAKKDWAKVTDWCIESIFKPEKYVEFNRYLDVIHEIWILESSELLRKNREVEVQQRKEDA